MIQRFSGASRESMERFAIFWGISWFTIVKGWHFTEFAVLTVLCARAIAYWRRSTDSLSVVLAMIFCAAFAVSDEWHQSFIPDRYGTVHDVLIDCLGVFIAGGIMLARQHRMRR